MLDIQPQFICFQKISFWFEIFFIRLISFQSQHERIMSESRRDRLYSESRRDRFISENRRDRLMSEGSEGNSECRIPKRRHRRYSTECETPERDMISFGELVKSIVNYCCIVDEYIFHSNPALSKLKFKTFVLIFDFDLQCRFVLCVWTIIIGCSFVFKSFHRSRVKPSRPTWLRSYWGIRITTIQFWDRSVNININSHS